MSGFDITSMLNEVSNKSLYMEFQMLTHADIVRNPKNTYSLVNIDELEESIINFGILQPLIVRRTEKLNFMLIAGERRYTASAQALDKGHYERQYLPCLVLQENTPQVIEDLILHETNLQSRPFKAMPEEERINVVENYVSLLEEAKKQKLVGKGRTRDLVAQKLDCSPKTVQKYLTKIKHPYDGYKSTKVKTYTQDDVIRKLKKVHDELMVMFDERERGWTKHYSSSNEDNIKIILETIRKLQEGN